MKHIESRPSKRSKQEYDFFVDCQSLKGEKLTSFVESLKERATTITVHSSEEGQGTPCSLV